MTKDELIRIAISIGVAMLVLPLVFRGQKRSPWTFPVASAIAVAIVVGALIFFGREW